MASWSDDTFEDINAGGDYEIAAAYPPGNVWVPASPSGVSENYGFGAVLAVRIDAATGADQYVRVEVPELASDWSLTVRAPAGAPPNLYPGYSVRHGGGALIWYLDGEIAGYDGAPAIPSGAGSAELRVVADVATLYVNDTIVGTVDYSAAPITADDAHQGFGAANGATITTAEGGDVGAAPSVPEQVPGLAAHVVDGSLVNIDWGVTPNGGSPITGFHVQRAPDVTGMPGTYADLDADTGTTVRAYADGTVANLTGYWWRVAAINAIGEGAWSDPVYAFAEDPPPPAFSDDWTAGPLANWVPTGWRSMTPDTAGDPGHDLSVYEGRYTPPVAAAYPPDDIFVDADGNLFMGCGWQNYGDRFLRCNQRIDLSGTVQITTSTILWTSRPLLGWVHLYITDEPINAPSMEGENSHGPIPRYGVDIRLNYATAYDGALFHPSPAVYVYDDRVESAAIVDPGHPVAVSETEPTDLVLTFTRPPGDPSHLTITADGLTFFDADIDLPAELTEGWVYLGAHNHASRKYRETTYGLGDGPEWDSYNAVWGPISWTGAALEPQLTYQATPPYDPHTSPTEGPGMDMAWNNPVPTLTVEDVPANVSAARLLVSAHFGGAGGTPANFDVQYRLNGNALRTIDFEYRAASGSYMAAAPIDVDDLVAGDNVLTDVALVGYSGGYAPFLGDVGILVEEIVEVHEGATAVGLLLAVTAAGTKRGASSSDVEIGLGAGDDPTKHGDTATDVDVNVAVTALALAEAVAAAVLGLPLDVDVTARKVAAAAAELGLSIDPDAVASIEGSVDVVVALALALAVDPAKRADVAAQLGVAMTVHAAATAHPEGESRVALALALAVLAVARKIVNRDAGVTLGLAVHAAANAVLPDTGDVAVTLQLGVHATAGKAARSVSAVALLLALRARGKNLAPVIVGRLTLEWLDEPRTLDWM